MTPIYTDQQIIGRHTPDTAIVDEARNLHPEHWQAIRQAIGRRLVRYESHLFATGRPLGYELLAQEDAAEPAPVTPPALDLTDLWKIRAELLREPMLLAIWFVDRADEFVQMSELWADYSKELLFYPSLVLFDRALATPDDWRRAPWFAVFPGVWAEMSDGKHTYLLRYSSELERERATERGWIAPLIEYADSQ